MTGWKLQPILNFERIFLMANICDTELTLKVKTSSDRYLLNDILQAIRQVDNSRQLVDVAKKLGLNFDPDTSYWRDNVSVTQWGENSLTMIIKSAWTPTNMFDELVSKVPKFKDVEVSWYAEEPGEDLYVCHNISEPLYTYACYVPYEVHPHRICIEDDYTFTEDDIPNMLHIIQDIANEFNVPNISDDIRNDVLKLSDYVDDYLRDTDPDCFMRVRKFEQV